MIDLHLDSKCNPGCSPPSHLFLITLLQAFMAHGDLPNPMNLDSLKLVSLPLAPFTHININFCLNGMLAWYKV